MTFASPTKRETNISTQHLLSMNKSIQNKLRLFARLATCNPFLVDRIELEKQILGDDFAEDGIAWSRRLEFTDRERFNVTRLTAAFDALVEQVGSTVQKGKPLPAESNEDYWDVLTYALLYRHIVYQDPKNLQEPKSTAKIWEAFRSDYEELTNLPGLIKAPSQSAVHLFAILCQVHRAFFNIYTFIVGESLPSIELRGKVWQSIFSHDMGRYRRSLFQRMSGLASLITGPSGTGKELVARAIGLSQFVPFDETSHSFKVFGAARFFPLNLSAMSPNLIESELFGHRKGSFTGAVADRKGWLELCPPEGAVFLDEIGELDSSLQVKLLRVVQQRKFSRLGDSEERVFAGKIIGATNRNLSEEINAGRFREDLYYRLCADRIETPSLRQQLVDRPEDLPFLVGHIVRGLVGECLVNEGPGSTDDLFKEEDSLRDQALSWIEKNLGEDYPWRGNFRELEQCISSIMIRGEYLPEEYSLRQAKSATGPQVWVDEAIDSSLSADELLQRYCTWVYFQTESYEAAARLLKLDRRTVKAKIDDAMLRSLRDKG